MSDSKPLVIIGAGPGGVAAALRAAQLGAQVKLIEANTLGGVCTSRGCVPLRVLGSSADLADRAAQAQALNLAPLKTDLDRSGLAKRVAETAGYIMMGTEGLLKAKGVELIRGRASLSKGGAGLQGVKFTANQGQQVIATRAVILAAGAGWAKPNLPGADLPGVVKAEELLTDPAALAEKDRLLIVGGQPWAVELARFFARFGAKVSLVLPGKLLPELDRQVAGRLKKALKAAGVEVLQQAQAKALTKHGSGLKVELAVKGKAESVKADKVVFTARRPSWEGLGLRSAGVEVKDGAVQVNARLQTANPAVFALGDLTGGPMLSHKASAQGVIAAENALGGASIYDPRLLPKVLFTEPEAAWVGLSEKTAKDQGLEVVCGEVPYGVNARAAAEMNTAGFVKIICGTRYKEVLGVHILGPHSAELITQAALAVQLEATAEELCRLIAPHPAYSEALVDAARMVLDGALYLP